MKVLFSLLLLFPLYISAQETEDILLLDEVVATYLGHSDAEITEISKKELSQTTNSSTIDGALTSVAGLDITRSSNGSGAGTGSVTLRGFGDSQMLVLLNGRPLNGSGVMGNQFVDWSSIATKDVEKVVIIRGSKNAEFGNTIGGVINIITQNDSLYDKITAGATFGFTNQPLNGPFENKNFGFSYSQQKNIGDRALFSIYSNYQNNDAYLRNNSSEKLNFGTSLLLKLPQDISIELGSRFSYNNRGFIIENSDTSLYYDSTAPIGIGDGGWGPSVVWESSDSTYGDRSYGTIFRAQYDFRFTKEWDKISLTALGYLNNQHRKEFYYALSDTSHLILERHAQPDNYSGGWKVKADHTINSTFALTYGFEGKWDRYSGTTIHGIDTNYVKKYPASPLSTSPFVAQNLFSSFIQGSVTFGNDERFDITTGFRYDYYSAHLDTTLFTPKDTNLTNHDNGYNPNLTITSKLWSGGALSLSTAYATRFATPGEYFWYNNGYDPASQGINRAPLSAEKAFQVEGIFSQELLTNGLITLRGYHYNVDDYLVTIFGYRPSRVVYNIDKVLFTGFEAEMQFLFFDRLALKGSYTYQHTEKYGDVLDSSNALSTSLFDIPANKGNASLTYHFINNATIGINLRFVGEMQSRIGSLAHANASQIVTISPFTTAGIYGSYPLVTHDAFSASIRAGIDNIFNVKYEEVYGFPMEGTSAQFSIQMEF